MAPECRLVEWPLANDVGRAAQLKPALTLSHAVVSWLNAIAAPREPLQVGLGDRALSVRLERLVWQQEPSVVTLLDCVWCVGDETVALAVPRALAEALISAVQNGLALPSEPSRSLVLELALEPLLARLEAQTQRAFQLIRASEASTAGPYLEFDLAFGPFRGKGRLMLFSPLDGVVPPAFRAFGELLSQLPRQMRRLSAELPVRVAGEMGALRASLALLRKAQPGDALLPDTIPFARGEIILTAARLWAPASVSGDRLILGGPFRSQPHPLEYVPMTTPMQPSEADLDDIEITLVFECGRWPITLGLLRNIAEGHVFELGRPVDGPVDILANGQRIGRGDIVRIGDELGIRLRGRLAVHE